MSETSQLQAAQAADAVAAASSGDSSVAAVPHIGEVESMFVVDIESDDALSQHAARWAIFVYHHPIPLSFPINHYPKIKHDLQ